MDLPIKIERTNKVLSANGGLLMLSRLFKRAVAPRIADSLPMLKSGSAKSLHKFRDMSLGLAAGADCLDDMD